MNEAELKTYSATLVAAELENATSRDEPQGVAELRAALINALRRIDELERDLARLERSVNA